MTTSRCGTPAGYQSHVVDGSEKCAPCRQAHADTWRAYITRRYLNRGPLLVDATGTRRRINALAAIGWPAHEIGRRIGVTGEAVRQYTSHEVVQQATAEKVAAVYDELSMIPGPSKRMASYAARQGWAVPLMWDEEDLDDPAAVPHNPPNPHGRGRNEDLDEQILALTRAGLSAAAIALRLRTHQRHVVRVRTRHKGEVA